MTWWKKMLLGFGLFAVWFIGLFVVGGWGYPSQYFWISGTFVAASVAVAPFWRLRGSSWFWPTAVLIEVVNLALLWAERGFVANPTLPSKGVVKGLMLLACMADWAIMVGACWGIRRQFPWQLPDE